MATLGARFIKLFQTGHDASDQPGGFRAADCSLRALPMEDFPLDVAQLAGIIELIDAGKLNYSVASKQLFPYLLDHPEANATGAAESLGLFTQADNGELADLVQQVLDANPAKVAEYRAGKKSLTGMFMGELMKLTGGKADPKLANQLLRAALEG